MKRFVLIIFVLLFLVLPVSAANTYAGIQLFPNDNIYNVPVDTLPLHPNNTAYIAGIRYDATHDGIVLIINGHRSNILYNTTTKYLVQAKGRYGWATDGCPYPTTYASCLYSSSCTPCTSDRTWILPAYASINRTSDNDQIALVLDVQNHTLYEYFDLDIGNPIVGGTYNGLNGNWETNGGIVYTGSASVWDMDSNDYRVNTSWYLQSVDAWGGAMFPEDIKYEEIQAGSINHALSFGGTRSSSYTWPARGQSNTCTALPPGGICPPMGSRMRLKSTFDDSSFSAQNKIITAAMKKYGLVMGGSQAYPDASYRTIWVGGQYHPSFTSASLAEFQTKMDPTDFEFVDISSLMVSLLSQQSKFFGDNETSPDPPYTDPYKGYKPPNIGGEAPLNVTFTDISYDNPNNATYWIWAYNNTDTSNVWIDFSYDKNTTYVFTVGGDYIIRHTTGNDFGENTTPETVWVNVTTTSTVASFTKSKSVVRIPSLINFNSTSTGASFFNWSFADGTYGTTANVTHRYTRPGLFNVTLTATNSEGLGSSTAYDTVRAVRGGISYEFTPGKELKVSCQDLTYTSSRQLTEFERMRTDEKMAEVCYEFL